MVSTVMVDGHAGILWAVAVFCLLAGVGARVLIQFAPRWPMGPANPRCIRCAYDVRHATRGQCPECGLPLVEASIRKPATHRRETTTFRLASIASWSLIAVPGLMAAAILLGEVEIKREILWRVERVRTGEEMWFHGVDMHRGAWGTAAWSFAWTPPTRGHDVVQLAPQGPEQLSNLVRLPNTGILWRPHRRKPQLAVHLFDREHIGSLTASQDRELDDLVVLGRQLAAGHVDNASFRLREARAGATWWAFRVSPNFIRDFVGAVLGSVALAIVASMLLHRRLRLARVGELRAEAASG